MKAFVLAIFAAFATTGLTQDCPEAKQISCVDDVRAAYAPCKKA